ncbi:hypothetical protein DV735_g5757, partial [Chaetothyriales sp. CBS 134920]
MLCSIPLLDVKPPNSSALAIDPHSLTDDEIVEYCQVYKSDRSHLLSPEECGTKVIALTDSLVVKFGVGVRLQEARTQQFAHESISDTILRIPKVYRFFSRPESRWSSVGYLVMEKINGLNLQQLDNWNKPGIISRIATALDALHSISSTTRPGPVSGGLAHGYLYAEKSSETEFHNINDLESYLNNRLALFGRSVSLARQELCLCHMDVAPRNFMIDTNGQLYLIDWATAGFYPRYFELWSIQFASYCSSCQFGPALLQSLKTTTGDTELENLTLVYRFNMRHAAKAYDEQTEEIMAAICDDDH